eukprot:5082456-Pyramimonas_sp.AAC.1
MDLEPLAQPGLSWKMLRPGLMHVGCLGVTSEVNGNVLREVFKELGGARSNPLEEPLCAERVSAQAHAVASAL